MTVALARASVIAWAIYCMGLVQGCSSFGRQEVDISSRAALPCLRWPCHYKCRFLIFGLVV